MHWGLSEPALGLAAFDVPGWVGTTISVIKVVIGFSLIIFVHELGHCLAAKWVGIRVDRFAIGFLYRLFGWRRGEGFTFGSRPNYTADELQEKQWGETDYCFKLLPFGGYVKMLGQDDIQINDDTGEVKLSDDPRAFTNKPVGKRMFVVSAGVLFNLLFAILGFMCVFMIGRHEPVPQIGIVDPGRPAAEAGLRTGDVVLTADGSQVDSLRDIIIALILSDDDELRLTVQRDGKQLPHELVVKINRSDEHPLRANGIMPYVTTELATVPKTFGLGDLPTPKIGDRVTHVMGREVGTAWAVQLAISGQVAEAGDPVVELTVERPDPRYPDAPQVLTCYYAVNMILGPAGTRGPVDTLADTQHILGFLPRRKVGTVTPGKPADRAGLRTGDVIVQWGTVLNPLYGEIVDSIRSHPERAIPVVVERQGETVNLSVTPTRPFRLFGTAPPRIGVLFDRHADRSPPIVADVAEGAPAAALNMPRGAQILTIDGRPVKSWFEVAHVLRACAGRTVAVRYRSGGREIEGRMDVPSSIVNELDLPPEAMILSIAGESQALINDNLPVRLPDMVAAARPLLEKHAGQTVKVRYVRSRYDPTVYEADFAVRADLSNADPWQMRIILTNGFDLQFKPKQRLVRTRNPLAAAGLGVKHTGLVLVEVYQVIRKIGQNLASRRTDTVKQVSGPVGIVSHAVDRAEQGYVELLFFFAFLSVNLAVLNFLPFPVVDGGLMVFLIIEKVKGTPLSIKTQMVATLVGLATIVLLILLVTYQDIARIVSG